MNSNRNKLRENIGQFLRYSRRERSLSGKELGNLLNISQQQISRYERGVTSMNIETLDCILYALDKSWADFFYSGIFDDKDNVVEHTIKHKF